MIYFTLIIKRKKKNYDLYYKITLSTAQFLKVTKFITNLMMYSNVLLKSKLKESTIDNTINIHRREKKNSDNKSRCRG